MLVYNGIAQAKNLLAISQNGYPNYSFNAVNHFLQMNPNKPIFLLHSGTANSKLMTDKFNVTTQTFHDLGFSAADFDTNQRLQPFNHLQDLPLDVLTTKELSDHIQSKILNIFYAITYSYQFF